MKNSIIEGSISKHEDLSKMPLSATLHFDFRQGNKVESTSKTSVVIRNPTIQTWFTQHNKYFTLNDKDYWFNPLSVEAMVYNFIDDELLVKFNGVFVNKEKSISYCKATPSEQLASNFRVPPANVGKVLKAMGIK